MLAETDLTQLHSSHTLESAEVAFQEAKEVFEQERYQRSQQETPCGKHQRHYPDDVIHAVNQAREHYPLDRAHSKFKMKSRACLRKDLLLWKYHGTCNIIPNMSAWHGGR